MNKYCDKCGTELSDDDFLCHSCGAILGDTVRKSAEKKSGSSNSNRRIPLLFGIVMGIVLLAAVVLAVILLGKAFPDNQNQSSLSSDLSTTQTTAPLVSYNVQIKLDERITLKGATILVYHGDQIVYTCQSGQFGKATIILPEEEGYYIRLADLPVQLQIVYGEIDFPFSDGQRDLVLTLEEQPVPYTVKVVDEVGKPLAGTRITFNSMYEDAQTLVSDENGCCVFYSMYMEEGNYATVDYAPTGYYSQSRLIGFDAGSLNTQLVLRKYEDMEILDSQCLYTVQILDEYDAPVSNLAVSACYDPQNGSEYRITSFGQTNLDGYFTFVGDKNTQYFIMIPTHPDYSQTPFSYEEGSRHQQIHLEMHKTEFTYTVQFVNQFGEGVPRVMIKVSAYPDNGQIHYYTGDDDGVITFQSTEADPSKLILHVVSVPIEYGFDGIELNGYFFPRYGRSTVIELTHQTLIRVVDENGTPIPGAVVQAIAGEAIPIISKFTDEKGQAALHLSADIPYQVRVSSLPKEYKHLTYSPVFVDRMVNEITIRPFEDIVPYTINFHDQETGKPIAGVQIAVSYYFTGKEAQYYTSDENGVITFESADINSSVYLRIASLPDDYTTVDSESMKYILTKNIRTINIRMKYDGKVAYKVFLRDEKGNPVAETSMTIWVGKTSYDVKTDDKGFCTFRLSPDVMFDLSSVNLNNPPYPYRAYEIYAITIKKDNTIVIQIGPIRLD